MLVWLGNYGHLCYRLQQELLRELGDIEHWRRYPASHKCSWLRSSKAVLTSYREWVKQPQVHVDESPGRCWESGCGSVQDKTSACSMPVIPTRVELNGRAVGEAFDGVISSD